MLNKSLIVLDAVLYHHYCVPVELRKIILKYSWFAFGKPDLNNLETTANLQSPENLLKRIHIPYYPSYFSRMPDLVIRFDRDLVIDREIDPAVFGRTIEMFPQSKLSFLNDDEPYLCTCLKFTDKDTWFSINYFIKRKVLMLTFNWCRGPDQMDRFLKALETEVLINKDNDFEIIHYNHHFFIYNEMLFRR
jgi:hypothetical protein